MFFQPILNDVAMMNFQIIHNQKDFPVSAFDQPFHELDHRLRVHLVFLNVSTQSAPIGIGKFPSALRWQTAQWVHRRWRKYEKESCCNSVKFGSS